MTKVTGYKLGSWNIIPGMDKIISLYHPIQSGSRASPPIQCLAAEA
jgi:hypothetical protein